MEVCFCYTHQRSILECSPVSIKCRFSPPQSIWEKRLAEEHEKDRRANRLLECGEAAFNGA